MEIVLLIDHPRFSGTIEECHRLNPMNVGGFVPSSSTFAPKTNTPRTYHAPLSSYLNSSRMFHLQSRCIGLSLRTVEYRDRDLYRKVKKLHVLLSPSQVH